YQLIRLVLDGKIRLLRFGIGPSVNQGSYQRLVCAFTSGPDPVVVPFTGVRQQAVRDIRGTRDGIIPAPQPLTGILQGKCQRMIASVHITGSMVGKKGQTIVFAVASE